MVEGTVKIKKKESGTVLHSVKTKLVGGMVLAMAIAMTCLSVMLIRNLRIPMMELNQSYLYDLAVAYGEKLQTQIEVQGYNTATYYNNLADSSGQLGLQGVDYSYAYLVASDGTMLYHPTKEKVGQPVENEVVTGVVQEIATGVVPEPNVVEYDFKGVGKYASYYVTERGHCILVVTADKDELMSTVNQVTITGTVATIIMVIIASLIAYLFVGKIVKPILKVTDVVGRLAHMDFSEIEGQEKLTARADETGQMSRAVAELRRQLVDVVTELRSQSERLFEASDLLNTNASETATTVEQVEKAVSEISEGASSQADETQKATENVILMGNMVEETTKQVEELTDNANAMRKSSEEAVSTLQNLEKINDKAREAIDVIYEQTNTTNESAMKIREATTLITSIAEETNLLSLNASIEAARAGEQGRGFAVVASEISNLANQTQSATVDITDVIRSVSDKLKVAAGTVEELMESNRRQSESAVQAADSFEKIAADTEQVDEQSRRLDSSVKQLAEANRVIVESIQTISAIMQEVSAHSQETFRVSENNTKIVGEVDRLVEGLSGQAKQLNQNRN